MLRAFRATLTQEGNMRLRTSIVRGCLLCMGLAALLSVAPSQARAEVTLGPHAGVNFDWGEVFIGGESRIDLATLSADVKLQLNPSLSLAFFDHGTAIDIACNVPFQFTVHDSVVRPFAAPGLSVV